MVDSEQCERRVRRIRGVMEDSDRQQAKLDAATLENQQQLDRNRDYFRQTAQGWMFRASLNAIIGVITLAYGLGDKYGLLRWAVIPIGLFLLVDALHSFHQGRTNHILGTTDQLYPSSRGV